MILPALNLDLEKRIVGAMRCVRMGPVAYMFAESGSPHNTQMDLTRSARRSSDRYIPPSDSGVE